MRLLLCGNSPNGSRETFNFQAEPDERERVNLVCWGHEGQGSGPEFRAVYHHSVRQTPQTSRGGKR